MPPKSALSAVFRPPIDGAPPPISADDGAQITAGEGQSVSPATQLSTLAALPVSSPALATSIIGLRRVRDSDLTAAPLSSKRARGNGTLAASSSSASAPLPYTSTAINKERIDEIIKVVIKAFGSPSADNFKHLLTALPNHLNSATIETIHNVFKNQFAATLTDVNAPRRRTKKEIERIHHINDYLEWRYHDAQRRDWMTPENRGFDEHLTEQITRLTNELASRAKAGKYPIDYEFADGEMEYPDYLAAHPEITTFDNDPDSARALAAIYALAARRHYIGSDVESLPPLSDAEYTRLTKTSNRAPALELIQDAFYPQRGAFAHSLVVPDSQSDSGILSAIFTALAAAAHADAAAAVSPTGSGAILWAAMRAVARTTAENVVSDPIAAYYGAVTAAHTAVAIYKYNLLFDGAVSDAIPSSLRGLILAYLPDEDLVSTTTANLDDKIITDAVVHLHAFDAWIRREQIRKAAAASTSSSSIYSPAVAAATLSSVPAHASSSSR